MIGALRIARVALVGLALTLLFAPLQVLAIRLRWPLARRLPRVWHRAVCRAAGLKVRVVGRPGGERPLLLVSNHQSWADIMVLGSAMDLCFIAKAEVRDWPGFGLLARLQRTVFVERAARTKVGEQADAIARRMSAGDAMVLFAEGTTSDGNGVLPFKSSLFGAAQASLSHSAAERCAIQPVSVAYTHASGLPMGRYLRPLAAWPGDVTLLPHLAGFLREGAIDAEIRFGAPIAFTPGSNRKAVTAAAERAVARMLAESLAGRPAGPGEG